VGSPDPWRSTRSTACLRRMMPHERQTHWAASSRRPGAMLTTSGRFYVRTANGAERTLGFAPPTTTRRDGTFKVCPTRKRRARNSEVWLEITPFQREVERWGPETRSAAARSWAPLSGGCRVIEAGRSSQWTEVRAASTLSRGAEKQFGSSRRSGPPAVSQSGLAFRWDRRGKGRGF
jgi:hypothetical protein